jgi:lactoylglutathione lyase
VIRFLPLFTLHTATGLNSLPIHNSKLRSRRFFTSAARMSSAESPNAASGLAVVPGRPTWQQTMLRIKDPVASLKFYRDTLGMTLIDTFDFPQYKFSLYFLTTLPAGEEYTLTPGTQEAHDYVWSMEGVALELTHNHGTEADANFPGYHPGNGDRDGFGHIAVSVDDVYAVSDELEQAGWSFKKKPDEGRMKGLAFVYDPDGYWVEIVMRGQRSFGIKMNFSQTMLRIKDPEKSLAFYKSLGMHLLAERHFDSFSLYFMGSGNVDTKVDVKDQFQPVLELTHNHGTEADDSLSHFNGNEEGRQGYGHIGFLVDDVYAACDSIRSFGYGFRKEPDGGSMKGLAFCYDPDGYSIEIIKRGGIDFGDEKRA